MPRESLAALTDLDPPVAFIHGNGETDVLALWRGEAARAPEAFHEALRWSGDALTSEQRRAIETWPRTAKLEMQGLGKVLFCHATPRDDNEIFTRVTPEERLAPILDDAGADLVVCGHTHMQFDRFVGDVRVINAGSVGMPFGSRVPFGCYSNPGRLPCDEPGQGQARSEQRLEGSARVY